MNTWKVKEGSTKEIRKQQCAVGEVVCVSRGSRSLEESQGGHRGGGGAARV